MVRVKVKAKSNSHMADDDQQLDSIFAAVVTDKNQVECIDTRSRSSIEDLWKRFWNGTQVSLFWRIG